ncbi:hypothetical protein HYH03_012416 [Edaphochlamys debaryana]|uniref:Uncharacterized protein n=1 Tax=Edaphochlamys debaryana TaxID=47281 RepID=A0A836BU96_9CHLO|nr:hypothetical protein HYH03_012416 [Edaphochlamys debaryana]|eukprot:KAG2489190.1 hypothetical protein HYH03_012416 [Edaphochlamys debaryana]
MGRLCVSRPQCPSKASTADSTAAANTAAADPPPPAPDDPAAEAAGSAEAAAPSAPAAAQPAVPPAAAAAAAQAPPAKSAKQERPVAPPRSISQRAAWLLLAAELFRLTQSKANADGLPTPPLWQKPYIDRWLAEVREHVLRDAEAEGGESCKAASGQLLTNTQLMRALALLAPLHWLPQDSPHRSDAPAPATTVPAWQGGEYEHSACMVPQRWCLTAPKEAPWTGPKAAEEEDKKKEPAPQAAGEPAPAGGAAAPAGGEPVPAQGAAPQPQAAVEPAPAGGAAAPAGGGTAPSRRAAPQPPRRPGGVYLAGEDKEKGASAYHRIYVGYNKKPRQPTASTATASGHTGPQTRSRAAAGAARPGPSTAQQPPSPATATASSSAEGQTRSRVAAAATAFRV